MIYISRILRSLGIGHQLQFAQGWAIIAMHYEPLRVESEAQNNAFNEDGDDSQFYYRFSS